MAKGYKSDLDLGIGQMPEIKDNPQVFVELQGVYNALHLLNAGLTNLRKSYECNADTPAAECFNFEGKTFWAKTEEGRVAGDIVCWRQAQHSNPFTTNTSDYLFRAGVNGSDVVAGSKDGAVLNQGRYIITNRVKSVKNFALVLEDRDEETGMALIGWPPAIIQVDGMAEGQTVYGRVNDPKIYTLGGADPSLQGIYPIGIVVAPNSILLDFHFTATYQEESLNGDSDGTGGSR